MTTPISVAAPARTATQALWNATAWVLLGAYVIVATAVVFRLTTPEDYGLWALALAVRGYLTFLDGGLSFGVARDVAITESERSDPALERIASARTLYVALGVGAAVVGILAAVVLPVASLGVPTTMADSARLVIGIIGVDAGIMLFSSPVSATIRGLGRFDVLAYGTGIQVAISIPLLVVLTHAFGVAGAAATPVAGRVAAIVAYQGWILRRNGAWAGWHLKTTGIRAVLAYSLPIWLVAAGTEIGMGTDVPIVGAVGGPSAMAQFSVGSIPPAAAAGLLFALLDVAFYRMAAGSVEVSRDEAGRLVRIGCALAGAGFATLAVSAPPILKLWVGEAAPLAQSVLVVYSVVWALNVPAHVLALEAIARARHGILAPIVLAEAGANLVLSVLLAGLLGPVGPAIGTLVTLSVSNCIVVPILLLRRAGVAMSAAAIAAASGYTTGLVPVVGMQAILQVIEPPDLVRVLVSALWATLVGLLVLDRLPGVQRRHAHYVALITRGGWRVAVRQRREVNDARIRLAGERVARPTLWTSHEQPLVTVRIATYNRGNLVAERAIASALHQTHRNIEVLVVGDACDAATEAAVRTVRDPRVRFENLAKRGDYPQDPNFRWMVAGSAPMNRALEIARGEWIAPLDDDDEFTPTHIEVLLQACRSRGLEFAYGVAEMETRPGHWQRVGSWPLKNGHIVHAATLYHARLRFMRHAVDSWRLDEPGDWNLWHRMRSAGVRMGFVDEVVCRHYLEARESRRYP